MKISVIIPVGDEHYIEHIENSLLKQDIENQYLELIIVDDATTKKSGELLFNNIKDKFPLAKLVKRTQSNGAGPARNSGLEYVTGDIITFVDKDDSLSTNYFSSTRHKFIDDPQLDIIIVHKMYLWDRSDTKNKRNVHGNDNVDMNNKDEIAYFYPASACGKFYKKEIYGDQKFPMGSYEDIPIWSYLLSKAKKIKLNRESVYNYFICNEHATTKGPINTKDIVENINLSFEYASNSIIDGWGEIMQEFICGITIKLLLKNKLNDAEYLLKNIPMFIYLYKVFPNFWLENNAFGSLVKQYLEETISINQLRDFVISNYSEE